MRQSALLLAGALLALPLLAHGEPRLTADDVSLILAQAVSKASRSDTEAIVAVTDREGFLLGLWDVGHQPAVLPPFSLTNLDVIKLYAKVGASITRASTAAFLSSNGEAFTSRTAGFIIQQHFPPGVRNTPNGPLVGVGFSSLFFTDVNRVKLIPPGFDGAAPVSPLVSPGVRAPAYPLTSLDDSPGGVPLYKGGTLVGGVGVTGDGFPTNLLPAGAIFFKETQRQATSGFETNKDADEEVALTGQTGYRPPDFILATNVLISGIRIPYVYEDQPASRGGRCPHPGDIGHTIAVPLGGEVKPPDCRRPRRPLTLTSSELRRRGGPGAFPAARRSAAQCPVRARIGRAPRLKADEVQTIIGQAAAARRTPGRASGSRSAVRRRFSSAWSKIPTKPASRHRSRRFPDAWRSDDLLLGRRGAKGAHGDLLLQSAACHVLAHRRLSLAALLSAGSRRAPVGTALRLSGGREPAAAPYPRSACRRAALPR